jgi:hypothetical protein
MNSSKISTKCGWINKFTHTTPAILPITTIANLIVIHSSIHTRVHTPMHRLPRAHIVAMAYSRHPFLSKFINLFRSISTIFLAFSFRLALSAADHVKIPLQGDLYPWANSCWLRHGLPYYLARLLVFSKLIPAKLFSRASAFTILDAGSRNWTGSLHRL